MFTSSGVGATVVSRCTTTPLSRGASAFAMQQFPYLDLIRMDRETTYNLPHKTSSTAMSLSGVAGQYQSIWWNGWIIRLNSYFAIKL
jgi:hypothetical protein